MDLYSLLEQSGNNISYCGVILDNISRTHILQTVKVPADWRILTHHMTIKLGELPNELKDQKGEEIYLEIVSIGISDKAIAVGVNSKLSQNKIPHITVAVNDKIGAKPKDSNFIENWTPIEDTFFVSGIIDEIPFK